MFATTTLNTLIGEVNDLTDNDGYNLIATAQYASWVNNELQTLWAWASRINRDVFSKTSSTFTITSGNTYALTASPGLNLTDYLHIRGVDALIDGTNWRALRQWNMRTRDRTAAISYRVIGETLHILPADQAGTYPLRIWYVYKQPIVSSGSPTASISIPEGADEYIRQGVAAKVRTRLGEDGSIHKAEQMEAREVLKSLLKVSRGSPNVIVDVSDDFGPELT